MRVNIAESMFLYSVFLSKEAVSCLEYTIDSKENIILFADSYEVGTNGSLNFYRISKSGDKNIKVPVYSIPEKHWISVFLINEDQKQVIFEEEPEFSYDSDDIDLIKNRNLHNPLFVNKGNQQSNQKFDDDFSNDEIDSIDELISNKTSVNNNSGSSPTINIENIIQMPEQVNQVAQLANNNSRVDNSQIDKLVDSVSQLTNLVMLQQSHFSAAIQMQGEQLLKMEPLLNVLQKQQDVINNFLLESSTQKPSIQKIIQNRQIEASGESSLRVSNLLKKIDRNIMPVVPKATSNNKDLGKNSDIKSRVKNKDNVVPETKINNEVEKQHSEPELNVDKEVIETLNILSEMVVENDNLNDTQNYIETYVDDKADTDLEQDLVDNNLNPSDDEIDDSDDKKDDNNDTENDADIVNDDVPTEFDAEIENLQADEEINENDIEQSVNSNIDDVDNSNLEKEFEIVTHKEEPVSEIDEDEQELLAALAEIAQETEELTRTGKLSFNEEVIEEIILKEKSSNLEFKISEDNFDEIDKLTVAAEEIIDGNNTSETEKLEENEIGYKEEEVNNENFMELMNELEGNPDVEVQEPEPPEEDDEESEFAEDESDEDEGEGSDKSSDELDIYALLNEEASVTTDNKDLIDNDGIEVTAESIRDNKSNDETDDFSLEDLDNLENLIQPKSKNGKLDLLGDINNKDEFVSSQVLSYVFSDLDEDEWFEIEDFMKFFSNNPLYKDFGKLEKDKVIYLVCKLLKNKNASPSKFVRPAIQKKLKNIMPEIAKEHWTGSISNIMDVFEEKDLLPGVNEIDICVWFVKNNFF